MLHFRMDMPFYLMAFYGSIMIAVVLLLRALLKDRLPKFVFPALWGVVLLRLLVPFSLSSPLSLPVPAGLTGLSESMAIYEDETIWATENLPQTQSGTAGAEATGGDGTARAWASESPDIPGTDNDMAVAEEVVMEGSSGYIMDTGTSFLPRSFFLGNNSLGSNSLRKALPALYLLGLAAVAGILAWQKITYAKRLKGGLLMEHNETVNGLLRDMGMGHVLVFSNDEIASPLACGLIGPRICLPTRMDFGNTVLLRHVLAHEAMHIRRRDNWVKAVMLAALVLNWYNPLVWLMAKCLASDLEAACDAAVLKKYDTDERKSYAYSLLAMAVSASRSSLLYSAFSKTEVERRVKGILAFRKASAFALLLSVLLLAGGTVAASQDPDIIREAVQAALAREFGVERSAFDVSVSLCLDAETVDAQYAEWGIECLDNGFLRYQGEQVRIYRDEMLGSYQSREDGGVDIVVRRNRLGEITAVDAWHAGEEEYDRRTKELERHDSRY